MENSINSRVFEVVSWCIFGTFCALWRVFVVSMAVCTLCVFSVACSFFAIFPTMCVVSAGAGCITSKSMSRSSSASVSFVRSAVDIVRWLISSVVIFSEDAQEHSISRHKRKSCLI